MKVHDTIPPIGEVFEWDISEILTRKSGDAKYYQDYYGKCGECGEVTEIDYPDCEHDDAIRDMDLDETWEYMMELKTSDAHYEDLKTVIDTEGFTKPLTAFIRCDASTDYKPELVLGDGHHRLFIARELGMTCVPVKVYENTHIEEDSGDWSIPYA